jgi:CRP-like cAMP-binding protein
MGDNALAVHAAKDIEDKEYVADTPSNLRAKRNTDSILEDVCISTALKIRLEQRWMQVTKQSLEARDDFSKFVLSQLGSSLDAMPSTTVTTESATNAANLAIKAAMDGYFSNIPQDKVDLARKIFIESLQRVTYDKDEFLCRQKDAGDKLYVLEEGKVDFLVHGQFAGSATNGSVFGELSLIYGVPRQADIRASTNLICWTLDTLAFRRVQAIIARDALDTSKSKIMTKFGKAASSLSEEQETIATKKEANEIPFEHLKLLTVVGKGTFGAVYIASASSRKTESFALKRMSKKSIVERENETRVIIERNALSAMRGCPFIITLMGTYQDRDCVYFLTECVQGGNLISYMIDRDILTHSETCFYTYNIASALAHCHDKGYIHRDVKPENCLIDEKGYIKLCDFGMAKRLPATVSMPNGGTEVVTLAFTMCGTPEFMALEFVLSTGYDKAVDIWALGCIMVEMYSGRGPFDCDGDLKKTFKAVCLIGMGRKKLELPRQLRKKGREVAGEFATAILAPAATRLGSEGGSDEFLNHPYFNMLDKDAIKGKTFEAPYVPKITDPKDASNFVQEGEKPKEEDAIHVYTGDTEWCKGF